MKLALFLPLVFVGCIQAEPYRYTVPTPADDGWETSSLGSENLAAEPIKELFDRIHDDTYKNIHSVVIAKSGKLIVEEYFPGHDSSGKFWKYDRNTLHEMHSASKSVNSILIGIAIDQHLIGGVEEKAAKLFSCRTPRFLPKTEGRYSPGGLAYHAGRAVVGRVDVPLYDARNDHVAMNDSKDPVRYVFERSLITKPGEKFAYSSGITIALGELVHQASGEKANKFAEHHLFEPLGISKSYWWSYPSGFVQTGGGLFLRARHGKNRPARSLTADAGRESRS